MRLARIGERGAERPVALVDGIAYDLRPITAEIDGDFLDRGGIEATREALERHVLTRIEIGGERIGAPIARPSAVICIGMNYAAHAAESGSAPPTHPVVFLKTPNTVVGPDDPVTIPRGSRKTDWEVELGIVIAHRTSDLDSPRESLGRIAGFVAANDLSEREWQIEASGGQWGKGKSGPGFCPTGPWLVPVDEIDHRSLRLRSWVNGEPRQDSSTADMIFDVETLIWDLSRYMVLEPGDLILTGTPEGVALSGRFPYLVPGDVVEIEIDGLGHQRQEFGAA